jgi:glycerophosphoryl diester phosphodiesterase
MEIIKTTTTDVVMKKDGTGVARQNVTVQYQLDICNRIFPLTHKELVELYQTISTTLGPVGSMTELAKDMVRSGEKISAIAEIRAEAKARGGELGLKEAKDIVEAWTKANLVTVTFTPEEVVTNTPDTNTYQHWEGDDFEDDSWDDPDQ